MIDVVDMTERRATAIEATRELAEALAQPEPIPEQYIITEPGVYPDLPLDIYLRDPVKGGSLSCSGAKALLPPSCPALFNWFRTHRRPDKAEFDLGHAFHQKVLGIGPEIVQVKADNWKTKAAQKQRDEARAAGKAPLLTEAVQRVDAMVEAVRRHPYASRLLEPGTGIPEQTVAWRDLETEVWRRARLDWRTWLPDGRTVIVDLKSADSAEKGRWTRNAANFGYGQQDPFYCDGVTAVGLDDDPVFLFVVVEVNPPHLINVIQLDQPSVDAGRRRNRAALELFAACQESGKWPGYSDDVELVSLPTWYLMQDPTPT